MAMGKFEFTNCIAVRVEYIDSLTTVLFICIGLDVQSQNVIVDWQTYLQLYCIFEAGQIEKSSLIKFWIKFFDQGLSGKCPEKEYMTLLEELVRGKSL